nr:probable zinc protease PqqL [Nerophis lumbriciformis]
MILKALLPILLVTQAFSKETIVSGKGSDLPADPKAVFGTMDNGFNYIIYPHAEPPGRFSTRLHINAGSLHEANDQRGIAHFLEHMVFNGSRNFTPAELIPKMQRLGIAFGAHANAYTSFGETVYMLDLPNMEKETIDLTFTVMRDFADGALLAIEEIDKERGVIIAEKTSRDSVGMRVLVKRLNYLFPESQLANRLPIGTEEVIKNAPRERFVNFYSGYYRPNNMTFVVAGDFDAKEMEKRVRETFISLSNPEKEGQEPPRTIPPKDTGFRTEVFSDKELASDSLSLISTRPYTTELDTRANRIKLLPLAMANSMLSRRFSILAKKENSPILSGSSSRQIFFNEVISGQVSVTPTENRWEDALATMEQEFRRALLHGFTEAELEEARANTINSLEQAVKRAPTRKAASIATSYVNATEESRVVTTPETNLEIYRAGLSQLTLADCHQAFKKFWDTKDLSLILTTKKEDPDTKSKLASLYQESLKTPVEPPKKESKQSFAYTDFGTPGKITSQNEIKDMEATQLVLSNNIKVNLKTTDFTKNSISLTTRIGSGSLTMPKDKPGLNQLASAIYIAGGLGKHSADDLRRILAGKNVDIDFGVGSDAFSLGGQSTPEDLELQLQLMCAALTDPGFRPEAERQHKKSLPMLFNQIQHSMQGAMLKMNEDITAGDHRFTFPTQEQAMGYNSQMVKDWILPQLAKSPIELTIVGDFDKEKTIPLILKTFGALPTRETAKPDHTAERKINMPQGAANKVINFDSKIPNAASIAVWPIPDSINEVKRPRRFNILASILSNRMREEIREKLGASYSPRAGANPHSTLEMGMFQAIAQVKPEETEKYGKLMIELADKMARQGVSADELDRALKPLLSNIDTSLRSNSYWLGTVLSRSHEKPIVLDWARNRHEDYKSITVEELNKLAVDHLTKDKARLYQFVPKEEK